MSANVRAITGMLQKVKHSKWLKFGEDCYRKRSMADPISGICLTNEQRKAREKGVKAFNEIPGPKGLPYLGTLFSYKYGPYSSETYHLAVLENYYKYGKIFKETIAGITKVHLLDPEYICALYQQEDKMPYIPPLLETAQRYLKRKKLSPGLGNTNGEEWYRLRNSIQQILLKPRAVSVFLPEVNKVVDDFIERLTRIRDRQTGQVENFKNELSKWNIESAALACFDIRFGSLDVDPDSIQQRLIDTSDEIFELSLKLAFGIPWFKIFTTPTLKRLQKVQDFFYGTGQTLFDQTIIKIKSLVDKGELKEDQYKFITYLMTQEGLDYKDMSILAQSLLTDGLTATVPSLIGHLYCLATNSDKQEKLYDSIKLISPNKDKPITNDDLNKCQYLKACIKEAFRFFPIGVSVSRITKKDIIIGGYHIPAGTYVELDNNMSLGLPEYFKSPEKFLPERWMRSEVKTLHPYLLLPFGVGARTCAGRRFAEQEMQVLLIRLLKKFHIEWPHDDVMTQRYRMILTPNKQPLFRFLPRY